MWKFHLPNVWKTIKYIVGSDLSNIKTMDRKSNHSRSGVLLTAKSKKNTIQIPVPLQIKNLYMMTRYRVVFLHWYPPKSSKYQKVNLGVSRTIYVNVDLPNPGFP